MKDSVSYTILEGLPVERQHAFMAKYPRLSFNDQELIVEKGDPDTTCYFIADGAVKVINFGADGKLSYFAIRSVGECFGYYAAISGQPRTTNIVSVGQTTLIKVPADDFIDLVTGNPHIGRAFLKTMVAIMRQDTAHITNLTTLSAPQRVVAQILSEQSHQQSAIVTMPTRVEWAGSLAMTRETLSRILSDLTHQNLIAIDGDRIQIKDEIALAKLLS